MRRYPIAVCALWLAFAAVTGALAQSRSPTSGRGAPQPQPPSGHQTEPTDLNEGKSAAELFQAGCAVCHQSAGGLAKGRREGELTSFLRQHYTSGVQHAATLASYLASARAPVTATPTRQTPVDRPPAPIGSRRAPADDDNADGDRPDRRRKPLEASRPDREAPAKRRPSEKQDRPAATARSGPSGPTGGPAEAAPADEPAAAPTSAPPAEEKPAPPEIPL